jgi:hypothetical protein
VAKIGESETAVVMVLVADIDGGWVLWVAIVVNEVEWW